MDVRVRMGDAIDPFQLANGFEAVIGLSGTNAKSGAIPLSLTPTIQTIHAICYKASEWVGGSLQCRRGILVILWMSLVDVAVGDLVTCMSSKIYTLRGCKCTLCTGVGRGIW